MSEEILNSVNAENVEVVTPQINETVQSESSESVNTEVAPVQTEKPVQTAEDNAKYAQIRREAETRARDKTIAELGYTWNGQPITTYDQYVKAKSESEQYEREQAIRQEYEAKGVPDELIEELVESKKDRQERQAEKQARAEAERQNAEYKEFFNYFKTKNGRDFDTAKDTIPQEVWQMTSQGKTLADAYAIHRANELEAKVAEYEGKFKAQETNQTNAASTTGSLTGNGASTANHISFETFEANKHDQRWVVNNLSKINESRAKW